MSRFVMVLGALAMLVLGITAFTNNVQAAGGPGTSVSGTYQVANASFVSTAGRVTTEVYVWATDSVTDGVSSSDLSVFIAEYSGRKASYYSGYGFLGDEEFVMNELDDGSLTATVNVCEEVFRGRKPATCFDVTLNVTWTGIGTATGSSSSSTQKIDGCTVTSEWSYTSRWAFAAGEVLKGTENLTADPAWDAQLYESSWSTDYKGDCFF